LLIIFETVRKLQKEIAGKRNLTDDKPCRCGDNYEADTSSGHRRTHSPTGDADDTQSTDHVTAVFSHGKS